MIVKRGYRGELDLNNEQRTACLKHAGAARWAYNYALRRKQEARATGVPTPSAAELHREINALKKTEIPWAYDPVSTQSAQACVTASFSRSQRLTK